uniref:RING-type domain-containing protein n=2 Tax=Monopterus albus TaxID=43700 RepID=A0A3Q3K141_MONAL
MAKAPRMHCGGCRCGLAAETVTLFCFSVRCNVDVNTKVKPKSSSALIQGFCWLMLFHRRQRHKTDSNMETTQEKCYDPFDSSLRFVDEEDVLDFLCEGFKSRRALMSCGHAVTPMSLTKWCRTLLDQGETRFVCAQFGCNVEWPYAEVRKMALLTPEETKYFEKSMASNRARANPGAKVCPGCKSSVVRKNYSSLRVRCSVCTANTRRAYDFCWQCLRVWKGRALRTDRCGNDGCGNESLKTLATCPDITIESVTCPSIRACPTCGALLQHDGVTCKYTNCPRCRANICFVCLESSRVSFHFTHCCGGVAPRQTSVPVWRQK